VSTGLFFSLPYHGHIHPCLPVIEELVRRGERILAYTTGEFQPLLQAIGAEHRDFPHRHSDKRALVTMAHWQLSVTASRMDQLVREARASRAEYVLVDAYCHWGYALAQHLSLPAIVLNCTFPSAFQNISRLQSILLDLRRVPAVLPTVIRFLILDRRLARRWRTSPLVSPIAIAQPRKALEHLILAHELLRPRGVDASYHFVGPCLLRRGSSPGEPLPAEDGRPLVYVSLGTIFNDRPDFYRMCIEAYADRRYQVVISMGANIEVASLARVPENIHLRRQVDQIAVLERAALFVSHGGVNSLSEALYAGVPLVLFPQANDQFALSELMEQRGVAIRLNPGALSAQAIREATDSVVQDRAILDRCRELRDQMRGAGSGAPRAADLIFAALQRSHSRPLSQLGQAPRLDGIPDGSAL
jgi:MGT family glycosyltransferase